MTTQERLTMEKILIDEYLKKKSAYDKWYAETHARWENFSAGIIILGLSAFVVGFVLTVVFYIFSGLRPACEYSAYLMMAGVLIALGSIPLDLLFDRYNPPLRPPQLVGIENLFSYREIINLAMAGMKTEEN